MFNSELLDKTPQVLKSLFYILSISILTTMLSSCKHKSNTETKNNTQLLKKLTKQKVSPLSYFIYQIYKNSQKCNGEFYDLKTVCMEAIEYDKDNRTITFNYLNKYRVINTNNNAKKLAVKSINVILKKLGINDANNGMLHSVLENYEIPITLKENKLFLNNQSICIQISTYTGYIRNNPNLLSYYGFRDCNGDIKLTKKVKVYAL